MTQTLTDVFYNSVDTFKKSAHLREKRNDVWVDISSEDFKNAVEEVSAGLMSLGVKGTDRVAVMGENRPEWAYADIGALCARATSVTIYPSLPANQALYILNDSGAKVAFASNAKQAEKLLSVKSQAPSLEHIVVMDEIDMEGTMRMSALRDLGRKSLASDKDLVRRSAKSVTPDDLATLIYTSGTTGDPKGVMLTHGNIGSNIEAAGKAVFMWLSAEDSYLSFLPLCHVFERMGGLYTMLHRGVTIAYAESFEKVPANLLEVRPTILVSVPRLYEKVMTRVRDKVAGASPFKQKLFAMAEGAGREAFLARQRGEGVPLGAKLTLALLDGLVLKSVRAGLGGNVRLAVSGGAPLPRETAIFFGSMGIPIFEGYGLTETSPVITVNTPNDHRVGSVGKRIEGVEVKIAEDGEICSRGPHIMTGYYNKPDATKDAIDADGWFHTGDIGKFDDDGYLFITDRKKDIIVTSGGKNIAPQPIEGMLKTHPLMSEVVMVGNKRNFPTALIVPNFDTLGRWAGEQGLGSPSRDELVANPKAIALYESTVTTLSKDLAQFERIKKVTLLAKDFSIEAGELTPTLKVKRRVVENKYQDLIDKMYSGPAAQ